MTRSLGVRTWFAAAAILFPFAAHANIGDLYGFGSRSAALAAASAASGFDAYAAYSNPASLSAPSEKRMSIGFGILAMTPVFTPIQNVVVENNYVSDKSTDQISDVNTDYRDTFGQVLGLSYLLDPEWHRLGFGLSAFIPLNQIAYLDSGEVFAPEYFMSRSRTQRPQFIFGLSAQLTDWLSFGVGAQLAYSMTANGNVFLQTDTTKPSSMRLGASLKPKLGPHLGFLFTPDPSFSGGLVVRFPVRSGNDVNFNSSVHLTSFLPALAVNFVGSSALFYDPLTIEAGTSWEYSRDRRLYLQADYEAWSKYETPALNISNPTIDDCQGSPCSSPGFTVSPSNNPRYNFQDIVIPRIAHEWTFGTTVLRGGYAYRPSVLKDVSNGAGNYLDPPRHQLSAGLGLGFKHFLHFETPCSLDFHLAYQQLVTQTITKTPGNEAGSSGDKIGSPGYEAGGKIYGGGVSLSLAL